MILLNFLLGAGLFILLLLSGAGIVWCSKRNAAAIQWMAKAISVIWIVVAIVLFFKGQFIIAMGWIMAMALFLLWVVYKNKKEGK